MWESCLVRHTGHTSFIFVKQDSQTERWRQGRKTTHFFSEKHTSHSSSDSSPPYTSCTTNKHDNNNNKVTFEPKPIPNHTHHRSTVAYLHNIAR